MLVGIGTLFGMYSRLWLLRRTRTEKRVYGWILWFVDLLYMYICSLC